MLPDHVHGDDNHRADRLDKAADLSSMPISRSRYATLTYFDDAALACVYSGRSAAPVAILVCKLYNIFWSLNLYISIKLAQYAKRRQAIDALGSSECGSR
jgi:hypothetical protein